MPYFGGTQSFFAPCAQPKTLGKASFSFGGGRPSQHQMTARSIHGWLAFGAFFPLALTVLTGRLHHMRTPNNKSIVYIMSSRTIDLCTGMSYRIARAWLLYEKEQVHWLMDVHQMSVLGLEAVYPLLVGGLLLTMVLSGVQLMSLRQVGWGRRERKSPFCVRTSAAPNLVYSSFAFTHSITLRSFARSLSSSGCFQHDC